MANVPVIANSRRTVGYQTLTVLKPAVSFTAGDLQLVLAVSPYFGALSTPTSGWTRQAFASAGTYDPGSVAIFYKVATDAGADMQISGAGGYAICAWYLHITGAAQSSIFSTANAHVQDDSGSSSSYDVLLSEPTKKNVLAIALAKGKNMTTFGLGGFSSYATLDSTYHSTTIPVFHSHLSSCTVGAGSGNNIDGRWSGNTGSDFEYASVIVGVNPYAPNVSIDSVEGSYMNKLSGVSVASAVKMSGTNLY